MNIFLRGGGSMAKSWTLGGLCFNGFV